jgi:AsmA protein
VIFWPRDAGARARLVRWLLAGSLAALVLAVVAALSVVALVDPNRFKPRLERLVFEATGRELRLAGDLQLAFFPWLALRLGAGELGNAPGVSGPALARWREVRIAARLVPLLRGELVLGGIRIDGLTLQLVRDASGAGNWSGLSGAGRSSSALALTQIAGVQLREASLDYRDLRSGADYRLRHLELDTGAWRGGEPFDIRLSLESQPSPSLPKAQLELVTRLESSNDALRLEQTRLRGRLWAAALPSTGLPFEFDAALLRGDVGAGAFAAPGWTLRVAGATVQGITQAQRSAAAADRAAPAALEVTGQMTIERTVLREVLARLGVPVPPTRDPRALGAVDLACRYALAQQTLRITALAAHLDGTSLTGEATRALDGDQLLDFTLHGDQMDLTRYLKPEGVKSEPFELPSVALRALRARGTLALDAARLGDLQLKGVRLSLLVDAGGLHPAPGTQLRQP